MWSQPRFSDRFEDSTGAQEPQNDNDLDEGISRQLGKLLGPTDSGPSSVSLGPRYLTQTQASRRRDNTARKSAVEQARHAPNMKVGKATQQTRVFSPAAAVRDGQPVASVIRTYLMNVPNQNYGSAPGVIVPKDPRKVTIRSK